jgi:hypothetical protein
MQVSVIPGFAASEHEALHENVVPGTGCQQGFIVFIVHSCPAIVTFAPDCIQVDVVDTLPET